MTSNTNHKTIPGPLLNDNWIFLKPIGWPKLKKRINKQLERIARLEARLDSEQLRSKTKIFTNNSRNLPSNATIRKEYVRCGKLECPSKHGPYYYAYWKDNTGKLKKKYIGKYPPSIDKHKSSDNDCAASDTVIDSFEEYGRTLRIAFSFT